MREAAKTDDDFLTEVASHLIPAGGKRLRPAFLIASALSLDPAGNQPERLTDEMVRGGVAVELVHLGSLYHDDVMDEAETRRGIEAVNHRWGNLTAILAGDFLLAKASELAASLGTEVAELLAATIGRLCEGQVRELQLIYDVTRNEEQYLRKRRKTAELCNRVKSVNRCVERDVINGLTEFGTHMGWPFRSSMTSSISLQPMRNLANPPVTTFVRVFTLPVIRMIASGDPVKELFGGPLDGRRETSSSCVVNGLEIASSIETAYRQRSSYQTVEDLLATPGM